MAAATIGDTDERLKAIISNLYYLLAQTHSLTAQTTAIIDAEIRDLIRNLQALIETSKRLPTHLPIEIIQYVEQSRNPDIYTREFVELVMRYNQQQKGRSEAFALFRDVLAREMAGGIPDIGDDVRRVVEASGGRLEG